jgi:phosphomannomutase
MKNMPVVAAAAAAFATSPPAAAADTATCQVALPRDFVPTPFVAAGVSLLGCAAGVMVTASHNTKEYNGYKVSRKTST